MPAFSDLLRRVAEYYHGHGAEIAAQNAQLEAGVRGAWRPQPAAEAVLWTTRRCARRAPRSSDPSTRASAASARRRNFRIPAASSAACGSGTHRRRRRPDLKALYMASLTLTRMAEGGIYDQLGGGFARYSVDGAWMIPHFEKMLYDNGAAAVRVRARGRWPPARRCSRASPAKPRTGCCATCARPQAAFTPASTRTPKATRASSMSGRRPRFEPC